MMGNALPHRALLEKTLIFLFAIILVVDSVNGWTIRMAGVSVSAPYKFVLLILVVAYVRNWMVIAVCMVMLLSFSAIHTLVLRDVVLGLASSEMLLRFFSIVIFYSFFSTIIARGRQNVIFRLAVIAAAIIAINLALGLMGFGYAQYTDAGGVAIGSRGFFYSGNEISVAYVIVVALLLMGLIVQKRTVAYVITGMASIALAILLATKLPILSLLILFVSFPFLALIDERRATWKISRSRAWFVLLITAIFPLIVLIAVYLLLYKVNLIGRLSYFYESMDLVTLALSGRNMLAAEAWDAFVSDYSTLTMFFGSGQYWYGLGEVSKLVEIDPVDVLMTYGIFGLAVVYGFFFMTIYRSATSARENPYRVFVVFTAILLLGISTTAGHVVNSGLAAYLIAALLALGSAGRHYRPFRTSVWVADNTD